MPNLAPFSFFSIVSHYPPLVTITVGEKEKHHKDTSANIAATKGYVIHTVTEGWEHQMNESSASPAPQCERVRAPSGSRPSRQTSSTPRASRAALSRWNANTSRRWSSAMTGRPMW